MGPQIAISENRHYLESLLGIAHEAWNGPGRTSIRGHIFKYSQNVVHFLDLAVVNFLKRVALV
jgi:hypothetical protein